MTNTPHTPAGWYPDSQTPGQVRWWDGAQWTDRVQTPYQQAPAAAVGASTGTWQVWTIIGLFVLQSVVAFMYLITIDWNAYMAYSATGATTELDEVFAILNGWYFATLLVSFVAYAGGILLAYLDGRELANRGVDRPFHWAWSFIPSYGSTVYIIGRSVVVKRRTGGGLAPLWAYIIVFVITIIASVIAGFAMVGAMFSELSTIYPTY